MTPTQEFFDAFTAFMAPRPGADFADSLAEFQQLRFGREGVRFVRWRQNLTGLHVGRQMSAKGSMPTSDYNELQLDFTRESRAAIGRFLKEAEFMSMAALEPGGLGVYYSPISTTLAAPGVIVALYGNTTQGIVEVTGEGEPVSKLSSLFERMTLNAPKELEGYLSKKVPE